MGSRSSRSSGGRFRYTCVTVASRKENGDSASLVTPCRTPLHHHFPRRRERPRWDQGGEDCRPTLSDVRVGVLEEERDGDVKELITTITITFITITIHQRDEKVLRILHLSRTSSLHQQRSPTYAREPKMSFSFCPPTQLCRSGGSVWRREARRGLGVTGLQGGGPVRGRAGLDRRGKEWEGRDGTEKQETITHIVNPSLYSKQDTSTRIQEERKGEEGSVSIPVSYPMAPADGRETRHADDTTTTTTTAAAVTLLPPHRVAWCALPFDCTCVPRLPSSAANQWERGPHSPHTLSIFLTVLWVGPRRHRSRVPAAELPSLYPAPFLLSWVFCGAGLSSCECFPAPAECGERQEHQRGRLLPHCGGGSPDVVPFSSWRLPAEHLKWHPRGKQSVCFTQTGEVKHAKQDGTFSSWLGCSASHSSWRNAFSPTKLSLLASSGTIPTRHLADNGTVRQNQVFSGVVDIR
ncbi:hypothetical protein O3P69_007263 [Scylla paramamosain]|uniref:Uncharacterized protein n=1 Tax=Scylla paramamosain TaxID=85552 RepID=A0AAW0V2N3_SCYPA